MTGNGDPLQNLSASRDTTRPTLSVKVCHPTSGETFSQFDLKIWNIYIQIFGSFLTIIKSSLCNIHACIGEAVRFR